MVDLRAIPNLEEMIKEILASSSDPDDFIKKSEKGAADGVATLDSGSKIPIAQLQGVILSGGVSGGQTWISGTDASDDAVIDTTSDPTKGRVLVNTTVAANVAGLAHVDFPLNGISWRSSNDLRIRNGTSELTLSGNDLQWGGDSFNLLTGDRRFIGAQFNVVSTGTAAINNFFITGNFGTGIFWPSTVAVALAANGNEILRADADGITVTRTGGTGAILELTDSKDFALEQLIENTNTGANASVRMRLRTEGTGTNSDPAVSLEIAGAGSAIIGLDNSDDDSVKVAEGTFGTTMVKVDRAALLTVDDDTVLYVLRRQSAANTLQKVTQGAADSGGVGFKVLRIPN